MVELVEAPGDDGFPPLNIDNVDFLALYRQEIARRQAAQVQPN